MADMNRWTNSLKVRELNSLRAEVAELHDMCDGQRRYDNGQRRMATRVLQKIDARIEKLEGAGRHG